MTTVIPYLYRDGNNYKQHATLVLTGEITDEQRKALAESLDKSEYFIPEQIGMEHLGDEADSWTSFPNSDDDHCWHELLIEEIETRDSSTGPYGKAPSGTVEEFVAVMVTAHKAGWDDAKYGKRFVDADGYSDPEEEEKEDV